MAGDGARKRVVAAAGRRGNDHRDLPALEEVGDRVGRRRAGQGEAAGKQRGGEGVCQAGGLGPVA